MGKPFVVTEVQRLNAELSSWFDKTCREAEIKEVVKAFKKKLQEHPDKIIKLEIVISASEKYNE